MSGVVLLVPFTFVLALVTTVLIWRPIASRMRAAGHSLLAVILPLAIGVGLLALLGYGVLWLYRSRYGFGLSSEAANEAGVTLQIPKGAHDVNYRVGFAGGTFAVIDFQITESDFLLWMQAQGWTPSRFVLNDEGDTVWADPGPPFPDYLGLGRAAGVGSRPPLHVTVIPVKSWRNGTHEEIEVKNGYYFDNYEVDVFDDSGDTVVYNMETGRAYVRRTSF